MFPWYWIWMPQIHFPLSGGVVQDNGPDISNFFRAIRPEAGIGSIEKEVFEVASYGKQLGLILDVLLPLTGAECPDPMKARKSLQELQALYDRIQDVKAEKRGDMERAAVALLERIAHADPAMLDRIVTQFRHTTN